MGEIVDTLRAGLRGLAQSDARFYRGLSEELGAPVRKGDAVNALTPASAEGLASASQLGEFTNEILRSLCKHRGLKVPASATKPQLVHALLADPQGPPPLVLLPPPPVKKGKASTSKPPTARATDKTKGGDLDRLEARIDRLERLLLLVALQVGVTSEQLGDWTSGG